MDLRTRIELHLRENPRCSALDIALALESDRYSSRLVLVELEKMQDDGQVSSAKSGVVSVWWLVAKPARVAHVNRALVR